VGQLIAVQKIASGAIGKVGSIYSISAKLIDVATGSIDRTVSEDCDCAIELVLTNSINRLARKMANLEMKDEIGGMVLTRGDASLFIKSNPDSAHIIIDGERIGKITPVTIRDIMAGDHQILLKKTINGVEWNGRQVVRAVPNKITEVAIILGHEPTALQISSNPGEVEVYINKKQSLNYYPRYSTPAVLKKLNQGKTIIHFFKPGYSDTTLQVEVKPYVLNEISVNLTPVETQEKLDLQNTFIKHRMQRRVGKWSLLTSVIGFAFSTYFAYEAQDNFKKAQDALEQLKRPDIRNNQSLYDWYVEENTSRYYDYRFNQKAFVAALATSCVICGTGLILYF